MEIPASGFYFTKGDMGILLKYLILVTVIWESFISKSADIHA